MGGILHLRERDVCRVCMVLVLWMTGMSVYAQSVSARKVSCAFSETRLDEVIRHLSQEAGVSFIYSSNKTDLGSVVTLSVENRALEETLSIIGSQVNIEFRIQGRYVIIKPSEARIAPQNIAKQSIAGKVPVKARRTSDVVAFYPASSPTVSRLWIPAFAERELPPAFEPAFTQTVVSPVTQLEARSVAARVPHAGWYFSVGPVINDHSSGLEFQAGIRSAYLVFTPAWMSSGRYRSAFGVGTSLSLGRNLALTPIYLLGESNGSTSTRWRTGQGITELKLTEKTIHHQVKLLVQYAVAPSVMVKLGPTINQSTTTYDWYQTTSVIQRRSVISATPDPGGIGGAGGNVVIVDEIMSSSRPSFISEQRVRRAWIGWEASVAVKINFSENK